MAGILAAGGAQASRRVATTLASSVASESGRRPVHFGTLNVLHTPYYEKYCQTARRYTESERTKGEELKRVQLNHISVLAVQEYPNRRVNRVSPVIPDYMEQLLGARHRGVFPLFEDETCKKRECAGFFYDERVFQLKRGTAAFVPLPLEDGKISTKGFTLAKLEGRESAGMGGFHMVMVSCHIPFSRNTAYRARTLQSMVAAADRLSEEAGRGKCAVVIAGDFNFSPSDSEEGVTLMESAFPTTERWCRCFSDLRFTHRDPHNDGVQIDVLLYRPGVAPSTTLKLAGVGQCPTMLECLVPHSAGATALEPVFLSDHALCWATFDIGCNTTPTDAR